MNKQSVARRDFLKLAGGATVAAGAVGSMARWAGPVLVPELAGAADRAPDLYLAGTDGWISLPKTPAIPPFHPDNLAPLVDDAHPQWGTFSTYIFGFRNITGLDDRQKSNQKNHAQHSAPMFWWDEYDDALGNEMRVQVTNLGLALRPDLFDAHTLHWHGFRNVIPFFDGEPTGSVAVPTGRDFTYVYRPRDPGTYMYHCHVEDVEHVHMGMTGLVFVAPKQDKDANKLNLGASRPINKPYKGFLYNDGDGATGYDRQFAMFLSEVWAEAHWADAHIQLPEWSDYRADFAMINGRVYPDTLAPNGSVDPFNPQRDPDGYLVPVPGYEYLRYQPLSSRITCMGGEQVALRFSNLGFREQSMTTAGVTMNVVGRDATPMRGRDGTDTSYMTDNVNIGPGESFDVVFTAPSFTGGQGTSGKGYDVYRLYNRAYIRSNNLAPSGGFGGQQTEIHVFPHGALSAQQYPNHWGL